MVSNQDEEKASLRVISKTWNRDSHGLFDYESTIIKQMTSSITENCSLFREINEVKVSKYNSNGISLETRLLCYFENDNGSFSLKNPINFHMDPTEENINELQNKIWYVIKSDNSLEPNNLNGVGNEPYVLSIGDIIKLGRVKYAVTELKINESLQKIENDDEHPIFNLVTNIIQESKKYTTETICKFCYSNETDDPNNKLVTLCKCSGSIMNVHFNCLKKWIQTKLSNKENTNKTVISYLIKSFNCEICKKPYPLRFILNGQYYSLIDLNRPINSSYIILESLNQFKDSMNIKSVQVISLSNNVNVVIGRGNTADVRVNDISVSRTHAALFLKDNAVYLSDQKSKFGTLVLMKHQVPVPKGKNITLQIGRTLLICSEIPPLQNSLTNYCNTEPSKAKNSIKKPVFCKHKSFINLIVVQKVEEDKQISAKDINLNLNEESSLQNFPRQNDVFDVEMIDLNLSLDFLNNNNHNNINSNNNQNSNSNSKSVRRSRDTANNYYKENKNEENNDEC